MTASLSQSDDGPAAGAGSKLADNGATVTAPPGPPPDWRDWRTWLRSPVVQGLFALAIYAAVWLLTTAQPILHNAGNAHLDQLSMDPNFYTWCLRWWPWAISHGHNPLFAHVIRAPEGHSLAWVTTVPPIALLAAPLTLAAGPIVAFNVLTAIALPLSAWAAFVLCRRLTRQFGPSLVGGAVFGFSAYEMNHVTAGQLNLIFSLLLPILGYLVVRWRERSIGVRTFVILAGLTMAVQFYLFLETFADMTAILAVALVVGIVLAGRDARPAMLRLTKHLAAAYGIAFALALPYLGYALTTKPPRLRATTELDLASLVVPRPGSPGSIFHWVQHLEKGPLEISAGGYVGVPLLLLALVLAVTNWSSRIVRFLTCMLIFIVVASLGPVLYLEGGRVGRLPWSPLWHLPILRNAYPARLMLFAFLVLAVATALFLARPGKLMWLRWGLALVVIGAVVQDAAIIDVSPHSTVPTFISAGSYRQHLKPGEIVVVVSDIGNAGMLWQADTDFYTQLAGGYINQAITRRTDLPRPVQNLAKATPQIVLKFESFVRADKIGAILLDRNHEPQWVGIFRKMGLKGQYIGNVIVYPTNGCRSCRALDWAQLKVPPAKA
jgi:hypothetical protein